MTLVANELFPPLASEPPSVMPAVDPMRAKVLALTRLRSLNVWERDFIDAINAKQRAGEPLREWQAAQLNATHRHHFSSRGKRSK